MNSFSKIIGWIVRPFASLTQNIPILSLILVFIFCILYFAFSFYKSRVLCRSEVANGFAVRFKDEFIEDAAVFDTYLTKIYKICHTNQILPLVLNIIGIMLFVSTISVLYSPIYSFFGINSETKNEIVSFMAKNFNCKDSLSDFSLLNLVHENKEKLMLMNNLPDGLSVLLNSSITLFGVNFLKEASFNSISIICPILYLIMYLFSSLKTIIDGIKRKDKIGYISSGIQIFFLIIILGSAFVFPLVYFLFIFIYRIISIIYGLITKNIFKSYREKVKEELVPKCEKVYKIAKEEFIQNELIKKEEADEEYEESDEDLSGKTKNVSIEELE